MDILTEHYRLHEDEQTSVNTVDASDPRTPWLRSNYLTAKGSWACRRSAGTKHAMEAAFKLGNNYLIAKHTNKAFQSYLRAAILDHPGAQYNLGLMCLKGEGVWQDAVAGFSWIELAADNGDKGARELLQRVDQALVAR